MINTLSRCRWVVFVSALIVMLALLRHSSQDESAGSYPPAPTGATGGVGPVPRTCTGVSLTPTDDVQAVVDGHPPGTTFCLTAGTYRLAVPLEPREGDAFVGAHGAVLSGSKVLTGWRKDGGLWSTTGYLPSQPSAHGQCLEWVSTCAYTEDVFLGKKRLDRVDSPLAVRPGSFHADYQRNTITIGVEPEGRLVEQAVASSLIQGTVDNVTVTNLVLEQAANEAQVAAVEARQVTPQRAGSGWRILHNEVRLNHGVGLGFADAAIVSGNFVHHQGQLGFGAWGVGSVVSNNEIAFNGTAGYSWEWEAGGSKSWQTTQQTISHNFVHDNRGPGLWSDGGNIDTLIEYNNVIDNWGAGIQYEISYDATIRHNQVSGNGRQHKGWAWQAGIQIQSSGGTKRLEVAHNVVSDNANGITLIDSGDRANELPAPHGPHLVQNVWVHHNDVSMSAGETTGAVQDTGDPAIFTKNRNRFEANTYRLSSLTQPHFSWTDKDLSWTEWRAMGKGNDLNGQAEIRRR